VIRKVRDGPPEVMEKLMAGEMVDPTAHDIKTTPRFEAGAGKYDWLKRTHEVALGEGRANEVIITDFKLT